LSCGQLVGHRRIQRTNRRRATGGLFDTGLLLLSRILEIGGSSPAGTDDSVPEEPVDDGSDVFHHRQRCRPVEYRCLAESPPASSAGESEYLGLRACGLADRDKRIAANFGVALSGLHA